MTGLLLAILLVPVIDQALKAVILSRVGAGAWSLGLLGRISLVHDRPWLVRLNRRVTPQVLWVIWVVGAATCATVCMALPSLGWGFGLLVGGALSHVIEVSLRGSICDYVCLRFWPAFNLADVAITTGAVVVIVRVAVAASPA
jgi:lipoprotein signal peptidase